MELLASHQESFALLGLWLSVFLGDIDSGHAVSCTIRIVWMLYWLIDLQRSPILQSFLPKDSKAHAGLVNLYEDLATGHDSSCTTGDA